MKSIHKQISFQVWDKVRDQVSNQIDLGVHQSKVQFTNPNGDEFWITIWGREWNRVGVPLTDQVENQIRYRIRNLVKHEISS